MLIVQGIDELKADINRMAKALDFDREGGRTATKALNAAADPVLEQMRRNASVDPKMISGDLHDAINKSNVRQSASKGKHITIGVHRKDWNHDEYYPAYVEYCHGGPGPAPAHPYIRPAYDTREEEAYTIIRDELRQALGNT